MIDSKFREMITHYVELDKVRRKRDQFNARIFFIVTLFGLLGVGIISIYSLQIIVDNSAYVEIGIYQLSLVFFIKVSNLTFGRASANKTIVEHENYDRWICATKCHQDGHFICPFCDFESRAKNNFRGLCKRIEGVHGEYWRTAPVFKKYCGSCKSIPVVKRSLK